MTPAAWEVFEPFRELEGPNASNVARHRMIDDLLRARIPAVRTQVWSSSARDSTRAPSACRGPVGRAGRAGLDGGQRSEPPRGPVAQPLTRVPIAFGQESLDAALTPFRDLPEPVVVLEGVLPYLTAGEVQRLLGAIRRTFAAPTLICDLTTRAFTRRYAGKIGKRLQSLGAPYGRLEREPDDLIESAGFRLTTRESIVGRAVAYGLMPSRAGSSRRFSGP